MNGNGQTQAQGFPLMALVPVGVTAPQFRIVAQWHTPVGILCAPVEIPFEPVNGSMVVQLFVDLVNAGLVHQVMIDDEGKRSRAPLPPCQVGFGPVAEPEAPPPSRLILPGG